MALPVGLIPVFVFVLTVGLAAPIALGAHLFHFAGSGNGDENSDDTGSFSSALRAAVLEAGALYLVGVVVIWAIAGGLSLWEVAATLLIAGVVALVFLLVVPLVVGQRLIRRARDVDSDTALRFATYGWPIAMLAVFVIFFAPGGLGGGTFLSLGGPEFCLAGFCGIFVGYAAAVLLELVVAILGPGLVGLAIYSSMVRHRQRAGSSS